MHTKPDPLSHAVLRALDAICLFFARWDKDGPHNLYMRFCRWRDPEGKWIDPKYREYELATRGGSNG